MYNLCLLITVNTLFNVNTKIKGFLLDITGDMTFSFKIHGEKKKKIIYKSYFSWWQQHTSFN